MEIKEYRALKEGKEPETPQAPELDVKTPETSTAQAMPEVEQTPQEPVVERAPVQIESQSIPPENETAMYRRKYQEADGQLGLVRQQLQFQQQQLLTLQQQTQQTHTVQQPAKMPEFEDPQDSLKWIHDDLDKKYEKKFAAQQEKFNQAQLNTQRQQTAQRVVDSYPDITNQASPLFQQFTKECYQRGADPQNLDPFTLEAASAIAAAKCGILPQNIQHNIPSRQPLQTARPQIPGIQRMAPPAPPELVYNLSAQQGRWADTLSIDPSKVTAFMKKNAGKYVKADGTPLYGRRK